MIVTCIVWHEHVILIQNLPLSWITLQWSNYSDEYLFKLIWTSSWFFPLSLKKIDSFIKATSTLKKYRNLVVYTVCKVLFDKQTLP